MTAGDPLPIPIRAPFAGPALLAFLRARAIPGVEYVSERHYRRFVRVAGGTGFIQIEVDPRRPRLLVRMDRTLRPRQAEVLARVRRFFDLDAPAARIDQHLGRDPFLAPLVARLPGLRLPGTFDGWELAARAVLGQQVSVRAATTLSGRLVRALGARMPGTAASDPTAWRFPTVRRLAQASADEVKAIGLPRARAATLVALARAVRERQIDLSPAADPAAAMIALQAVPGIGPWTASYVSIRAFGAPDLFLPGDLAARKALGVSSAREAERRSARWSPYRSYALLHLWGSLAAPAAGPQRPSVSR